MAFSRGGTRKDSIKDSLTKGQGGKKSIVDTDAQGAYADTGLPHAERDPPEAPVTRSFLEGLFTTLRSDLTSLREEFQGELKGLRKDITDLGVLR